MARATEVKRPRRGEVYLVNFDPTIGAEVKKTRPAVVTQNDIGNRWSPITIVAAMTSRFERPPPESRSCESMKSVRVSR
jgi:mRNA interferase MazF